MSSGCFIPRANGSTCPASIASGHPGIRASGRERHTVAENVAFPGISASVIDPDDKLLSTEFLQMRCTPRMPPFSVIASGNVRSSCETVQYRAARDGTPGSMTADLPCQTAPSIVATHLRDAAAHAL